jgi:hypothetical protein
MPQWNLDVHSRQRPEPLRDVGFAPIRRQQQYLWSPGDLNPYWLRPPAFTQ